MFIFPQYYWCLLPFSFVDSYDFSNITLSNSFHERFLYSFNFCTSGFCISQYSYLQETRFHEWLLLNHEWYDYTKQEWLFIIIEWLLYSMFDPFAYLFSCVFLLRSDIWFNSIYLYSVYRFLISRIFCAHIFIFDVTKELLFCHLVKYVLNRVVIWFTSFPCTLYSWSHVIEHNFMKIIIFRFLLSHVIEHNFMKSIIFIYIFWINIYYLDE